MLIANTANDIPFDLKHHRHLIYEGSIRKLKTQLSREFEWVKSQILESKTSFLDVQLQPPQGSLTSNEYVSQGSSILHFDLRNKSKDKTIRVDAAYLILRDRWAVKQDGRECHKTREEGSANKLKHLLGMQSNNIAPGGWTQISCEITRAFWSKWTSQEDEPNDTYRATGYILLQLATSIGIIDKRIELDVEFFDIPF